MRRKAHVRFGEGDEEPPLSQDREVRFVPTLPRNILNVLFDNVPMASGPDRDTWLRAVLQGNSIRCFLVENGFVRQFSTPGLLGFVGKRIRDRKIAQEWFPLEEEAWEGSGYGNG